MNLIEQVISARIAGTPLLGITCYDPEATITQLTEAFQNHSENTPVIQWDNIRGWRPRNDQGAAAIGKVTDEPEMTANEIRSLVMAEQLPENTVLFVMNSHLYLDNQKYDHTRFSQAVWNLRDAFSVSGKTLILLGPSFKLPIELKQDVVMLDEELPDRDQILSVISSVTDSAGAFPEEPDGFTKAVDALVGLSAFQAEQATAMSIKYTGKDRVLSIEDLWERKHQMIDATPGLKVYKGKETYEDIGGCDAIKNFFGRVMNGKEPPNCYVFMDEGEKMFAGATHSVGDNTGIAQDNLQAWLTFMENNESDGAVLVGPPGASKSLIAKATGNEAGKPTIMVDFGAMRAGVVGESERKVRDALKIIKAVSGGRAFFIMTCNKDVSLPPELKRRFTSGTYFFDLPSTEEQSKIWPIYINKYFNGAATPQLFNSEGWTGAEIRNVCRKSYRENLTLEDASKYIVPVAISAKEEIETLRKRASGTYLSANKEGIYTMNTKVEKAG
jgi:hypothetical protein